MASSCCFFVFVWVWWLPLMLVPAEGQQQGAGCSAKKCGNLTFSDPFWLTDLETGRSCGSHDFEVTCYNNAPFIWRYRLFGFGIIHINYEAHSLLATDQDRLNLLRASNSCEVFTSWNTSTKVGPPFRIDPGNLDLVFYNCTDPEAVGAARRDVALVETRKSCRNQSEVFVRAAGSYNETSDYTRYTIEGCDALVVPVLGSSSGEANASDYRKLIGDGFLLTWENPQHGYCRSINTGTWSLHLQYKNMHLAVSTKTPWLTNTMHQSTPWLIVHQRTP